MTTQPGSRPPRAASDASRPFARPWRRALLCGVPCIRGALAAVMWPQQFFGERLGPVGVDPREFFGGHLQRVRGLGWRADDQPQLVVDGVVEELANGARLDEDRSEWRERPAARRRRGGDRCPQVGGTARLSIGGGGALTPGRASSATGARRASSPRAAWQDRSFERASGSTRARLPGRLAVRGGSCRAVASLMTTGAGVRAAVRQ